MEERLDQLREQGARGELSSGAGSLGYYDLPVLKKPVWTWEIPLYFFVGGAAGCSAVIAFAARGRSRRRLAKTARKIALAGSIVSAPLLISDLGRPERFLYMLRVFKWKSPMSVGVWTLVAFSGATFAAVAADILHDRGGKSRVLAFAGEVARFLAAVTGLGMATYTGVLVGATAIPAWNRRIIELPVEFGMSSLGSSAAILELAGHFDRALNRVALAAAGVETLSAAVASRAIIGKERLDAGSEVPRNDSGSDARMLRAGAVLSGPLPLALRLIGRRSRRLRRLAACSAIAGSLLMRYGWVAAGRRSAAETRP